MRARCPRAELQTLERGNPLTQGKRRPDGSKRRHARAGGQAGQVPRSRPLPLAPGFDREDEAYSTGSSDSIEEFVRDTFEKLIVYVLKEIDGQKSGAVPVRPFDANGQASITLPASMNFSIQGANPEDNDGGATLLELLALQSEVPEATFTTTRDGLAETLRQRTDALARAADERVSESVESELLESFALVCFVLLADTRTLIQIKFALLPPSPFQEHAGNNPATS